ncbi:uncharacterized protein TM35_000012200 [Trypanosoma theileri]|uniref:Transmembrane protein n=1 Tax=Trypanosoma theileri TaxID=67003 RepID=A0A1X0P9N0_9TRYP|nr:uncharacterized protein TM35_000012200 [Trypanosoma theileri]ORC93343.1 hypothetical protein TM35_000012200 [Trypanosoma theileri]
MNCSHTAEAIFEVPTLSDGRATFELAPVSSASLDHVPRQALKNYAYILNEDGRPFAMDHAGRIVFEVGLLNFANYDYNNYIDTTLYPALLKENSQRKLFFMLTQPRLYCLCLEVMSESCDPSRLPIVVDSFFMAMETRLMVKIFELSQWQAILKRLQDAQIVLDTNGDISIDNISEIQTSYSGLASILCSAPAAYTIFLEDIASSGAPGIVWDIEHRRRVIAVLVQCSNIPLTVGISVKIFNGDGKGSLEYFSMEMVYLTFFIAYSLLLVTLLILLLPCCCSYGSSVVTQTVHSREETIDSSTSTRNSSTTTSKVTKGSGNILVSKRGEVHGVNLYEGNSNGDNMRNDVIWNMGESNEDNVEVVRKCNCCSVFWKKMQNICCQHIFILYPTLQWLILVSLFVKMIICALRLAQYRDLAMSADASLHGNIQILSIVLTVCIRSVIFAMQQFVCIGWGCAYEVPPTRKTVVASFASIMGFSAFVLQSTCEGSSMISMFTDLDTFMHPNTLRCATIRTISTAVDLIGSLLNVFQITTLMATIGRAASTEKLSGKESVFNDNMLLYLRYRGMCVPYAVGIIAPQIILIAYSRSSFSFDDYYVETAVIEFVQWYALAFVLLFLRREPMLF